VTDHRSDPLSTALSCVRRLFPVVGDLLEQGFITWRVVDREPAHVLFVVEGMNEPPRRISLRQWLRVAARSARVLYAAPSEGQDATS
jgi:hypothetical protein